MGGGEHSLADFQRPKRVKLQLPVDVKGEDALGAAFEERTHSINLSGGGICFETRRTLAVGARLALRIELPPALRHRFGGLEVYQARAVVCRVESADANGARRIGARFLSELGTKRA
jgi:hypothetical protein